MHEHAGKKSALHALRWISMDGQDSFYYIFLCGIFRVLVGVRNS